jgi:hypothetical protein
MLIERCSSDQLMKCDVKGRIRQVDWIFVRLMKPVRATLPENVINYRGLYTARQIDMSLPVSSKLEAIISV